MRDGTPMSLCGLEAGFSMFKEWFQIEFNSMIEDLCDYELMDDAG